MRLLVITGIAFIVAGLIGVAFLEVDVVQSRVVLETEPIWQGRSLSLADGALALTAFLGAALVMLDGVRLPAKPTDL